MLDYWDRVGDAVEFLLALGSMMGVLMIILGALGYALANRMQKSKMISVVIVGILLVAFCGWWTGLRYFRINVR